ncbi:hypothetical protein OGATHE_004950 [Ogataea polymorpha]|uniref:Uncharacterized protein n=1 Tax=Ogataea polymorpha TaxID=460523 RepID=A0A9P8SZD6_9ASCO|nr:hypothetical protein OGATHE_004950 [Ogataea polymorpha]
MEKRDLEKSMPHPCTELDPDQHQDASRLVSSRKILNGHRICGLRFQHIREVFFVCGCDKPAGFGQTDALIDVLVLVHGERLSAHRTQPFGGLCLQPLPDAVHVESMLTFSND